MVRSASFATPFKLSPSRRSSLAAVSSICSRSASSRRRSREVTSFGFEVMLDSAPFNLHRFPLSGSRAVM